MKKSLLRTAFAISLAFVSRHSLSGNALSAEQSPIPPASPSYEEMVKSVEHGDLSVDFLDLRMKYAASSQYDPEAGSLELDSMQTKLRAKDYEGALKIADAVLAKQYVNIDAHIGEERAYQGLRNDQKAKLHRDIATKLVGSILDNGSGASPANAYNVISGGEEYMVIRVLGLQLESRTNLKENGRNYDKLDLLDPKKNSVIALYFDVTLSDQYIQRLLHH